MKRSAFAALCGISKNMISKYEKQGYLVLTEDNDVDPEQSLDMLAGRLNEEKRIAALQVLSGQSALTAPKGPIITRLPTRTDPKAPAPTAKVQKDAIERDLKALEYGYKSGQYLLKDDVEDQASLAITGMREAFANVKRDIAADLCAKFDIPPDRVPAVVRFLSAAFEQPLGKFAELARAMADPKVNTPRLGLHDQDADHFGPSGTLI